MINVNDVRVNFSPRIVGGMYSYNCQISGISVISTFLTFTTVETETRDGDRDEKRIFPDWHCGRTLSKYGYFVNNRTLMT